MKGIEAAVNKVLEALNQFTNPFSIIGSNNSTIFGLLSGQAAPAHVAANLLGYVHPSKEAADQFLERRLQLKTVKVQDHIKRQNHTT